MASASRRKLFSPVRIGPGALSHRVAMAPLPRMRSGPGDVHGDLMVEDYGQRASDGGLISSEATTISVAARGYPDAPGIDSDEKSEGWRRITEAVHARGGRMFLQLRHVGRAGHGDMTGGVAPVAPPVALSEGRIDHPGEPLMLPHLVHC